MARLYVAVQQGTKLVLSPYIHYTPHWYTCTLSFNYRKLQKPVLADTSLSQVAVTEETDNPLSYTQSEHAHDGNVHTHSKPDAGLHTQEQAVAEAGVRNNTPKTVHQQFSKPKSSGPSVEGLVPPHKTQPRSRSPSPRREGSPKQLVSSNNTTPILPVKSIAGAAKGEPKEVNVNGTPSRATASSVNGKNTAETTSPDMSRERNLTNSVKMVVSFQPSPAPKTGNAATTKSAQATPSSTPAPNTDITSSTKMAVSFQASPKVDAKSLQATSPAPKIDSKSSRASSLAVKVDSKSSRASSPAVKVDSKSSRASSPAPKIDSKSSQASSPAVKVDSKSSHASPPAPKPISKSLHATPSGSHTPTRGKAPTNPTDRTRGVTRETKPTSTQFVTNASGKDSKRTKLTTVARKIVKKPGLERESLVSFFSGKVAREHKETLMNILWGGASLTSTPGCEVEVGLFLSDKGLYLLQVVDTESNSSLSWYTENAPLICSFHAYHVTLSQVKTGIFDQSITFEFVERGALKSLVVFPRTGDNMFGVLDNLKAALDSSRIPHCVTSVQESILSLKDEDSFKNDCSKVLFVNPDVSDLQKLKESLVKPKVVAHLCSQMASFLEKSNSLSFAEDTKKASEDAAAKFEVVQYVVVSEISSDLLPISNGTVHFRPNVLILTNSAVFLCKDEIAAWPTNPDSPVSPPFPRCTVLDSYPIASVTGIEMCDKAQAVVKISDPVYEFRISFLVSGSESSSRNWKLCVYDRQYIDQFFSCLQLLWHDIHHTALIISHTAEPLTTVPPSPPPPTRTKSSHSFSEKHDITLYDPSFYKSNALVHLASLTSSERLKFFKEHVSEAEFLKSDEVPLAAFLAFCSTGDREFTQIEACIMASQYAVYLVSDVDNIRKWLDGGGGSSFSRMSLLNKQGADRGRCFFRLWMNEIKEVHMGFFYLSMQLTTSKVEHSFAIHSQDASSMLALLSAFSCSSRLRNTVEQKIFDDLLSDYIDLGGDSLSTKAKEAQKHVKTSIEFREQLPENQETLKQILLSISPSVRMSSTVEHSTSGLHIVLGQVMMMIEELSIRGTHSVVYQPQLVLVTNFGLFVCANSTSEDATPAVLQPSDLKVKRWCHIDLIETVEVVSNPGLKQCKGHVFSINLQSQKGAEGHMLVLAAQNSEQLKHFLYYLSLLWYERNERHLPIYTL